MSGFDQYSGPRPGGRGGYYNNNGPPAGNQYQGNRGGGRGQGGDSRSNYRPQNGSQSYGDNYRQGYSNSHEGGYYSQQPRGYAQPYSGGDHHPRGYPNNNAYRQHPDAGAGNYTGAQTTHGGEYGYYPSPGDPTGPGYQPNPFANEWFPSLPQSGAQTQSYGTPRGALPAQHYQNEYHQPQQAPAYYGYQTAEEDEDNLDEIEKAMFGAVSNVKETDGSGGDIGYGDSGYADERVDQNDAKVMQELETESLTSELRETWFPACRNCQCCAGFCHGCKCIAGAVTKCQNAGCMETAKAV